MEEEICKYLGNKSMTNIDISDLTLIKYSEENKLELIEFMKIVSRISSLRKSLKENKLIGIIGPQNSGKSTVTSIITRFETYAAIDKHTRSPIGYCIKKNDDIIIPNFAVIDWPGSSDLDKVKWNIQKSHFSIMSFCIIVLNMEHANNLESLNIIKTIKEQKIPSIVLLNRCDQYISSISNQKQTKPKEKKRTKIQKKR